MYVFHYTSINKLFHFLHCPEPTSTVILSDSKCNSPYDFHLLWLADPISHGPSAILLRTCVPHEKQAGHWAVVWASMYFIFLQLPDFWRTWGKCNIKLFVRLQQSFCCVSIHKAKGVYVEGSILVLFMITVTWHGLVAFALFLFFNGVKMYLPWQYTGDSRGNTGVEVVVQYDPDFCSINVTLMTSTINDFEC